jgi:hypothetical protein
MRQDKPVGGAVGRFGVQLAAWIILLTAAPAAAQRGPAMITVDGAGQDAGEPIALTISFPYGCPVLRFPGSPRQQGHDLVVLVEATAARCDEQVTRQSFTATLGPLAPGSYTVNAEKLDDLTVLASATFEVERARRGRASSINH